MEFLKHLKNIWDSEEIKKEYERLGYEIPQKSKGIDFNNNITLSIQGSYAHYCEPRKTLPYEQYKEMEFAILKEGKFLSVEDILNISSEENIWENYYDGTVYGYVPIELIEILYLKIKKEYGLQEKK